MSTVGWFGVLLIVATLGMFFWWALTSRPNLKYVARLTVILIVAGVLLVFNAPITEISFGKLASIRTSASRAATSAEKAKTDANAIAGLKEKIAAQAATVTEVSKKADETTSKTARIDELVKKANQAAEEIKRTADFSLLLAKVGADDRKAFDELLGAADDEDHPFHELALKAIQRVVGDLASRLNLAFDWKRIGLDPAKTSLEELKEIFESKPTFDKPGVLAEIFHQNRFGKFERLSFVYDVIKTTESILVLNSGCMTMNEEAKINKNIIGYREYLKWWDEHAAEYAGAKEYNPDENLARPPSWPEVSPTP